MDATAWDSASVLLVRDDPLRVLMVRRGEAPDFPAALVFPGGLVEPGDAAGVWNGRRVSADDAAAVVAAARELEEETGVRLPDADALVPFARWITPRELPRRWDTRFFVAAAPADQEPIADGREAVAVSWEEPAALEDRATRGEEFLLPPTRLNLMRLAESSTVAEVLAAARARPPVRVEPVSRRRGDRRWVTIPAEAGYAVTEVDAGPA